LHFIKSPPLNILRRGASRPGESPTIGTRNNLPAQGEVIFCVDSRTKEPIKNQGANKTKNKITFLYI